MTSQPEDQAGNRLTMVRPHLREIPADQLPAGFRLRGIRPEEGTVWERLWNSCDPFAQVSPGTFNKNFGDDPASIPQRCFFLLAPDDRPVGTISGWYNRNFRGRDAGRIHWVALAAEFRGRGLGRACLAEILRRLARWHDFAYLITQSNRLPAIKLYLNFDFEPAPEDDDESAVWRDVAARLDHPLLARWR